MLNCFIYSWDGFVDQLVEERQQCNINLQRQVRAAKAIIEFEKLFGGKEFDGVEV
jgi:hypothetical protein